MKIEIKAKYKNSKRVRNDVYDYVEKLAGRKLEKHEYIELSQLVKKTIFIQNESLIIENKRIQKAQRHLKQKTKNKINKILKDKQYVINK